MKTENIARRSIFIKGFVFIIVFCSFVLLFFLYVGLKDSFNVIFVLYIVALGIAFYHATWVKIVIDYQSVTLINGFVRKKISYNEFVSLRMGYFQPKFARGTIPAIIIKTKTNKAIPLYFRRFDEGDIVELIQKIKAAHCKTLLCMNTKKFIAGRESKLVKKYKQDAQVLGLVILGSIIVTWIYSLIIKK